MEFFSGIFVIGIGIGIGKREIELGVDVFVGGGEMALKVVRVFGNGCR